MTPSTEDVTDLVRFVYLYETEPKLLLTHVSDHTGHCTGCGSYRPVSPCDLQLAALRVATMRSSGQTPSACSPAPGS